MPQRLNQGKRGAWGCVVSNCNNQRDIQKPVYTGRKDKAFELFDKSNHSVQMGTGIYGGDGIMDTIRGMIEAGKSTSEKLGRISDIATGETATMIRNMLPSSDEKARPGFAGEKHAILKLPNGKYGVANYMGPGTQLEKRLKRGDPPRTLSDKVAQAHDSRYALAKSQKDVANADRKMIAKLKELQKRRLDSNFNIQMGMRPIQAKLHAESLGLVKPGKIASFGDAEDKGLVENQLRKLEQDGYGLPGDKLRVKLLMSMKKKKKKRKPVRRKTTKGKGLNIPGGTLKLAGQGDLTSNKMVKVLASCVSSQMLPMLISKLGLASGSGNCMSGSGITKKKLNSMLHMRMLQTLNDGASRKTTMSSKNTMVGRGKLINKLKPMATQIAKTLLPLLIKLGYKKLGLSGNGVISFEELKRRHENPTLLDRLSRKLAEGSFSFLKNLILGKKGSGMYGGSFWDGFKKGFMSVMEPAIKIGKTLAPLAPLLL